MNREEERSPEEIENLIVEGLDDIDRGDVIDGEEAFRDLRAYSAERRRQHAGTDSSFPAAGLRDLREIGAFISHDSFDVADRVVEEFWTWPRF